MSFLKSRSAEFFKLNGYTIVRVFGNDAIHLMQNLSSNNVVLFAKNSNQASMACCFLDTNGKLVTDARFFKPIIIKDKDFVFKENELLLLLRRDSVTKLINHVSKYTFKKDVEMEDIGTNFDISHLAVT